MKGPGNFADTHRSFKRHRAESAPEQVKNGTSEREA